MQRLHVQLLFTFQLDETHGWPGGCLGDRFRISIVVLLRLDVGPDIFRRHQPNLMALRLEKTAEVMRATTGLHRDDARRQTLGETNDTRRSHPPPLDDCSLAVQPHEAAAILTEIDPENYHLHLTSPALSNRQQQ